MSKKIICLSVVFMMILVSIAYLGLIRIRPNISIEEDSINNSLKGSSLSSKEDDVREEVEKKEYSLMPNTLYYLNVNFIINNLPSQEQYDVLKLIATLQGIVNREKPLLFIEYIKEMDVFWYNELRKEDNLLAGYEVHKIKSLEELLGTFKDFIKGVAVWDPQVPATANVVATICGIENYIPVRYDTSKKSIYTYCIEKQQLSIKINLRDKFTGKGTIPDTSRESTGSTKGDAYIWAIENYLKKGLCNDSLMAYVLDGMSWSEVEVSYPDLPNTFLTNHDYYIAKKAFFFDLSPWGNERPCDDKQQPLGTDIRVLKEILQTQYEINKGEKITTVGGFTPWQIKYTTHLDKGKHEGVPTEWRYAEILSAYNCIMDADAAGYCALTNASVYTHVPLSKEFENSKKKKDVEYDPQKTYLLFYMGDYDAAAWMNRHVPRWWKDEARGELPLMWCFNPNLSDRIPHVFNYLYENKTENDYFAAGDSGAGYLNPTFLINPRVHSELPTSMDIWIEHNKKYYTKFDLDLTGFIINGKQPINSQVQDAYSQFSPAGVGHNGIGMKEPIYNGTVFMPHDGDVASEGSSVHETVKNIQTIVNSKEEQQFFLFRTILVSPYHMKEVMQELEKNSDERVYELLDPYNFFDLYKQVSQ